MVDSLKMIADGVITGFLSGAGNLRDLTYKAASENSLSTGDISRISQMVNKEAQIRLYADKGPSGAFEFDMVDPSSIISEFNSVFEDPEPEIKQASSRSPLVKFRLDRGEGDNGLHMTRDQFLLDANQRLTIASDEIEEEIGKISMDLESSYNSIHKEIKNILLSDEISVDNLIESINLEDQSLGKIAEAIIRQVAVDDINIQSSLPSSFKIHETPVPVDRISGGQSLIKVLNTVVAQYNGMEDTMQGLFRIRDHVKYVVEEIDDRLKETRNLE